MDLIKELDLTQVINADGKMSILGVSKIDDSIFESMKIGGKNFFIMDELNRKIDTKLAEMFEFDNCHIVNSASSAIALSIAAVLYKDKTHDVNKVIPKKNQIVIAKGHNIDFGAPIEDLISFVGGTTIEAGYANMCNKNHVEYRINENTAALMYVVSHHCVQKQMLSLSEMISISKKYNLPLIVDCAAEDDIKKYAHDAIDIVIFSGTKAIEGPTSGLIFGTNSIIDDVRGLHKTIGRTMKVGKELLFGVYQAMMNFSTKKQADIDYDKFLSLFKQSETTNYIASLNKDSVRNFYRIKIELLKSAPLNAVQLSQKLKDYNPSIYVRDYFSKQNWIEIDLRQINFDEGKIVAQAIKKLLEREGNENE